MLPPLLRAAARVWTALLTGLSALAAGTTDAEKQAHGAVTHAYCQAFDSMLSTLMRSAAAQAEKGRKHPLPSALTRLLLALLAALDPAPLAGHPALFEGILSLLLARVGDQLFVLTFGHARGRSVEEDIELGAAAVGGDEPGAPTGEPKTGETAEKSVANAKARALLPLLTRALVRADAFLLPVADGSDRNVKRGRTGKVQTGRLKQKGKGGLATVTRERVQRALVEAVFGEVNGFGGGLGDEFVERLRRPPVVTLPAGQAVEEDGGFLGEVWRLVGWECLGREEW
ncbi:hypothetical protein EJ06DRAFT_142893 [Trichodelitschia bisporula]|uniref:Uncharacterized protein n=1 Tax=Trichodelitschia bisporula TaxID=703511 RepID=A0A6G1HPY9_9PEZI|nr:hypothetical protein EJ06DRAFT_142893 [Trichodelitschia bisporula]